MTEDMPEDVRKIGTEIASKYLGFDMSCQGLYRDVARAILAERRRCAQIAEDRAKKSLADIGGDESFYWEGSASAAQIIAAAIRGEGNGEG